MIKNCEYRHENGNCLFVGGFCTSVNKEHCIKEHDREIIQNYIDNIVKELETLNNKGSVSKTEKLITKATVSKAIEIVRKGGV